MHILSIFSRYVQAGARWCKGAGAVRGPEGRCVSLSLLIESRSVRQGGLQEAAVCTLGRWVGKSSHFAPGVCHVELWHLPLNVALVAHPTPWPLRQKCRRKPGGASVATRVRVFVRARACACGTSAGSGALRTNGRTRTKKARAANCRKFF